MSTFPRLLAEAIGAFTLTLVVWLSLAHPVPYSTPIGAALTLGIFVYTIGTFSGAQLNPGVTIGLWSIGKMHYREAVMYIVAQFIGAILASALGTAVFGALASIQTTPGYQPYIGEILGAFLLSFGVNSVVHKRAEGAPAGLVVGGSLLLGIYVAASFSNAVLNPAVALGLGLFSVPYLLAPIVGAVAAAWLYRYLHSGFPATRK